MNGSWDNNLPGYAATTGTVVITVPIPTTHPEYRPYRKPLRDIKLRDERAKWRR